MIWNFFKVAARGLAFLAVMVLLFYLLSYDGLIGGLLFYAVVQDIFNSGRKKIPVKPAP